MEAEINKRIVELETRIIELEKNSDFRWQQTKHNFLLVQERLEKGVDALIQRDQIALDNIEELYKNDKAINDKLSDSIKILKSMIDALGDEQQRARLETMKYDDAYYHIFPDRLAHDVKLSDQLDGLTSKPPSDASGKGS